MAVNTRAIGLKTERPLKVKKRTSQGTYGQPKNKHKRRQWKMYRGQG